MSRRWDKALEEKPIPVVNKQKSAKQEKRLAKEFGGRVTAGSGSGRNKGDIDLDSFKIEVKRTDNQSISLKKEWLSKIDEEAFSVGKYPALILEIDGLEWVAIPKPLFKSFTTFA